MSRDMTKAQFRAACERNGFIPEMLGYYRLPIPGQHVSVNVLNAGDRRRSRLAYLHRETERLLAKRERERRRLDRQLHEPCLLDEAEP